MAAVIGERGSETVAISAGGQIGGECVVRQPTFGRVRCRGAVGVIEKVLVTDTTESPQRLTAGTHSVLGK